MTSPRERGQLEWIEEDRLTASCVANQEARAIATIVALDLDRREFAVECHL